MLVTAVNKVTKEVLRNAAEHKLTPGLYIINPPEEYLQVSSRYWVIEGENLRIMSDAEKYVLDLPFYKEEKLRLLEQWWNSREHTGIRIQIPNIDITLGITPEDITLMNGVFTMADKCVALGIKQPTDLFQFHDKDGNIHYFTISQLTNILLIYSQNRAAMHAIYKAKIKAINAADTKAALDSVEIPNG